MPYPGVNVSQYVANLNSINPSQSSPESLDETFHDDDLALFATAQFFDFEMGQPSKEEEEIIKSPKQQFNQLESTSFGFLDDLNDSGFDYPELLPVFPNPTEEQLLDTLALAQPQQPSILPKLSTAASQTIIPPQSFLSQQQPSIPTQPSTISTTPTTPTQPKFTTTLPSHLKRKSVVLDSPLPTDSPDDSGYHNAADEDKRRRNTAASARFRVKKKQREQALEVHAKELEAKAQQLQEKVNQLEMENKWLKNLITDKKDQIPEFTALSALPAEKSAEKS